ncbi:MAG: NAD(P)/FAD-dependent oxidoreductase, partial [Bacteroidota bacterium]
MIESSEEGQLDPGKMMYALTQIALGKGVNIWNEEVKQFKQLPQGVVLSLKNGLELKTENLIIATNGFAKQLLPKIKVTPARTQVLITSPIENLKLKGVFHYDEGYFYFRNVGNRVLLGGGRNLDFQGEATDQFGTTSLIQSRLEVLLKKNILPGKHFQIEQRWSGIMGLGSEKK